jgi:hypothetical protein
VRSKFDVAVIHCGTPEIDSPARSYGALPAQKESASRRNRLPTMSVGCLPKMDREGVMVQARYFVVSQRDVWLIKFEDEEYGPYASRNEALLFAIDAAQKLGEHGSGAEVLLKGEGDRCRPEWTFGKDPYPPRIKDGSFATAA